MSDRETGERASRRLPDGLRTTLLVVQSTPFCNIDCSYCYLPDRASTRRMSFETAAIVFRKLLRFPTIGDEITLVWHAGEPLVLPVAYYERMFRIIDEVKPAGLTVRQSMQTNATLVTDEWCDFIRRRDVSIGVSIDGPAEFHDLNRKKRNGRGTFERTHAGLRKLQEAGIRFHVISVLGLDSMKHPGRMLDFYTDNAIEYVCFNVEEQEGLNRTSDLVRREADPLYKAFLQQMLTLNLQRDRPVLIREIDSAINAIRGRGNGFRSAQTQPLGIISVDCDANVSTFSPELLGAAHETYGSFHFGNLLEHDFEDIAARIAASRLYADIDAGLQRCAASCGYFEVCGGGAPSNKIFENGTADSTETAHCRTHKRAIDVTLDLIESIPEQAIAASRMARLPETGVT